MSEKKVIAVVGATGAQGGGLVRAILGDASGQYVARAITRDVNSDKAKALAAQGAEVVAADLDDVESLKKAFAGAYGVFGITNFWEHFSPEKEMAQAKNIAEAAKAAGAQHVIWSTLEDTRKLVPLSDDRMPTLLEKYKVPHFDGKGESDHFFTDLGVPTTFLLTSFYWDNFIHFGAEPKRGADGVVALTMPMGDKKLPGIAVEDIGRVAFSIFNDPSLIGKVVGIAGEHLTGTEMAQAFTEAFGEPVVYNPVPFEVYRGFGFPGADDMGNMYQFKHDFNEQFVGARDIERTRAMNPKLHRLKDWLAAHKTEISFD